MAGGWSRDGAEHEQMDATVNDALERARRALQSELEKEARAIELFNRRGSKDSQLR